MKFETILKKPVLILLTLDKDITKKLINILLDTKISGRKTFYTIKFLIENGFIIKYKRAYYKLTDKGQKLKEKLLFIKSNF